MNITQVLLLFPHISRKKKTYRYLFFFMNYSNSKFVYLTKSVCLKVWTQKRQAIFMNNLGRKCISMPKKFETSFNFFLCCVGNLNWKSVNVKSRIKFMKESCRIFKKVALFKLLYSPWVLKIKFSKHFSVFWQVTQWNFHSSTIEIRKVITFCSL